MGYAVTTTTYPRPDDHIHELRRADGTSRGHDEDHGHATDIWFNVKAYGAYGDNDHDDTAYIQACIDAAIAASTTTQKIVYFPSGVYRTTAALTVTLTAGKSIAIRGQETWTSSQGPIAGSYIYNSNLASNVMTVTFPAGSSQHSFHLEGLQLVFNGGTSTGACLDLTGGGASGEMSGVVVRHVNCAKGAIGIKAGGGVNVHFSHVAAHQCTTGWQFSKSLSGGDYDCNVYQFENCYAQACTGTGFKVSAGGMAHPRFTSCVFQGNAGPGFELDSSASSSLIGATFINCWWEFPGSDMVRLASSASDLTFIGCRLDGSGGGGGRHVIHNTCADASAVFVSGVTFIGCHIANLNGGYLLALQNADPSLSNDPCFNDVTFIGGSGHAPIEGLRTPDLGTQMSFIQGVQWLSSDIITNAVNLLTPRYILVNNSAKVFTDNGLGAIDFTEVTAPAAGATNHARLYAEDNGSGKTRLVVKFPTGAAQVIATEP